MAVRPSLGDELHRANEAVDHLLVGVRVNDLQGVGGVIRVAGDHRHAVDHVELPLGKPLRLSVL